MSAVEAEVQGGGAGNLRLAGPLTAVALSTGPGT